MSEETTEEKVAIFTLSRDFDTLMFVGRILSFVGWIIFVGCVISLFSAFVAKGSTVYILLAVGGIGILNSLLAVAAGQVISCFVSIERNTNDTNGLLKQILAKTGAKPIQPE